MKAKPRDIPGLLRQLPANVRAVLIFGRDEGLIRERASVLTRQVLEADDDPFRHVRVTPDDVKEAPSRLSDEVSALSFTPGRRVVRLDDAMDPAVAAVEAAMDQPAGDTLLLLVSGDLKPSSKIRNLAETRPDILAIACYPDEGAGLGQLIDTVCRSAGLEVSPEARGYLLGHLGADRALSRSELDKLMLYKEGDPDRMVHLVDARACVGDAAGLVLGQLVSLVLAGRLSHIDEHVERAYAAGESPIAILRLLLIRLQRLDLVKAHMARGLDAGSALKQLRPPVLWTERDDMMRDAQRWSHQKLRRALAKTMLAERRAKSTGLPDKALVHRLMLEIAAAGR